MNYNVKEKSLMLEDEEIRKKDISWKLSFALGALIGAVIFIGIYGFKVLDVSYDDWLLQYEFDLTQHYQGWRLYRNSGWHFPLGLCDTSIYPYLSSVVYTDSIPLFAFFFKLLSPILPDKFQYFGLFGLMSYMLQGGMAKLLLRKTLNKEWLRNVGAAFFVTNIVFVQRMFWQTALSAHFLILIAMTFFVYREDIKSFRTRVVLWTTLGALAVSIHFYLYGMISVMLLGFAVLDSIDSDYNKEENKLSKNQRILYGLKNFSIYIVSYLATSVVVFYSFGGFYGTVKTVDDSTSLYNASINSLFLPMGKSLFFTGGEHGDMELEGFGYMGIASAILLIFALIALIMDWKNLWKSKKKSVIIICLLIVMFYIFSLSPVMMFSGKYVFSVNIIPGFIQRITWGLFRACGRFIWPVMYTLTYLALSYSERILKKIYPVILIGALALQLVEFSGYYKQTYKAFNSFEYLNCPADVFAGYDMSQYKHIQFMQNFEWFDYYASLDCYYEFVGYSRLAADNRMTISNFHFARDYDAVVQEQIDSCYEKLNAGKPDADTLYVFPKEMYIQNGLQGTFSNVIEFDTGYDIVLIPE